jgi:hypothetical protein
MAQANSFQILFSGSAPVAIGGHFADFRSYRKKLKAMLAAAEARDAATYQQASVELVEQATKLEAEIQPIAVPSELKHIPVDIDFNKAIIELNRLLLRVERVIEQKKLLLAQKREEEEIIFLLALS